MVKIPGILVDAVVVAAEGQHMQTFGGPYNPAFSGEVRVARGAVDAEPGTRLLMGRIAASYLKPGAVVNLGIGMPEAVAQAAAQTGQIDDITLTVEPGGVGGIPASGLSFGATANAEAIIDQPAQFDFYDGGGLDQAFLGMAEVDADGNVNVSRFGSRTAGAGGFINISQNAGELFFMGSFTSGRQQVEITGQGLRIVKNGAVRKFVQQVQHLTFNGAVAAVSGRPVRYITERAVFLLAPGGLILEAIAPGVDVKKDILDLMDFPPLVADAPRVLEAELFA
jgi:propionate CoA-transferase